MASVQGGEDGVKSEHIYGETEKTYSGKWFRSVTDYMANVKERNAPVAPLKRLLFVMQ